MQAEEAGLDRHDDLIAGAQCVEGDQPDAGRAVNDGPLIGIADRIECPRQPVLAAAASGEDLLERRKLDVAGRKVEIRCDLPDDLTDFRRPTVRIFDQGVINGAFDLVLRNCQTNAAMTLGVHVHQQGLLP